MLDYVGSAQFLHIFKLDILVFFKDCLKVWMVRPFLYGLWNFQLNTEVVQQSHGDQPSLDLVEILNISSKDGRESSLNILLKEVLAAGVVEEAAVEDDEIG